jgi:NitT/TauT family transport system substrate-binding protein
LVCLICALAWALLRHPFGLSKNEQTLRIAVTKHYGNALLFIAQSRGLFEAEGVRVQFINYPSSNDCLEALWMGEVDLAASFEAQLINSVLAGRSPQVLTELYSSSGKTSIVYKTNGGIRTPADLVGRKVGLLHGSNAEFVLDIMLAQQGASVASIKAVEVSTSQHRAALFNGDVDAVVTWEPTTSQILTDERVQTSFFSADFYSEVNVLASKAEIIATKREAIAKALHALIRASEFFHDDPAHARDAAIEYVGIESIPGRILAWDKMHPHLGLSAVLVMILNEETEWILRRQKSTRPVKVSDWMAPTLLRQMAPELVTYE